MTKCRACLIFHSPRLNCRIALNQLKAGTLEEPWLSRNQDSILKEVATAIPAIPATQQAEMAGTVARIATVAVAKPEAFVCPVCEARRLKNLDAVKKYRARLVANRD